MSDKNKKHNDKFDKLLTDALKQYRLSVRPGFPQRMLSKLEQLKQTKALKKVVRQERALLAAFIFLPAAAIALGLMFPNVFLLPSQWPATLYFILKQIAVTWSQQWQLWLSYAVAAGAALYAIYDILLADN